FFIRLVGLTLGIIFSITISHNGWTLLSGLLMILGWTLFLFAHFITNPKRLWQFILSLPKRIKKVSIWIWKFLKFLGRYIYRNFIRLVLFGTTIFSFIYGIAIIIGKDFLNVFTDMVASVRISIGFGLLVMSIASFFLLRHELKKLIRAKSEQLLSKATRRFMR
ncbi:MAG: hypothetical protein ACTSPI_15200, partial [Candidatus Heimdallarchaeaceae archaeon]